MPTAATQILTVEQAKAALRIDGTSGDVDLEAAIEAAVDYCARRAEIPLLDVQRTHRVRPPALNTGPLIVPERYVLPGYANMEDGTHPRGVESIKYWSTTQTLRDLPSSVDVESLGRVDLVNANCTGVWPAADGWPSVLAGSMFVVTVTLGWPTPTDANEDPAGEIPGIKGLRRAVTLATGLMYDGSTDASSWDVVHNLLGPFKDMRKQG